jgi:hypothetical protein
MNRSRAVFLAFTGLGAGCLVLAGLLFFSAWQPSASLVVDEPHRIIDDLLPGSSRNVDFEIQNRTGRPLRIVGANSL